MIRMMDSLYTHKTYQRAARGALRVLLRMAKGEKPSNVEIILPGTEEAKEKKDAEPDLASTPEEEAKLAAMTAPERKKYRAKLRKQNKKKENAVKDQSNSNEEEEEESPKKESFVDPDPLGLKALASVNAIPDALKWCATLIKFNQLEPSTFALIAQTYLTASKYSLALRAISAGFDRHVASFNVEPVHGDLLVALVQFCNQWDAFDASAMNSLVKDSILNQLNELLRNRTIEDFIRALVPSAATASLDFRVSLAHAVTLSQARCPAFNMSYACSIVVADTFCNWDVITAKSCIRAINVCAEFSIYYVL